MSGVCWGDDVWAPDAGIAAKFILNEVFGALRRAGLAHRDIGRLVTAQDVRVLLWLEAAGVHTRAETRRLLRDQADAHKASGRPQAAVQMLWGVGDGRLDDTRPVLALLH